MEKIYSELKRRFLHIVICWLAISLFFFLFPSPDNSISSLFFKKISSDLLPSNVKIISPNPAQGLITILTVSFMLGFCFSLPITSYNLAKFFSPALYPNEKKLIVKISLSIIPLFLVGCLFAYFLFIPLTIKLLYYYIFSLEIVPFIDLNFFINFILLFTVIMGIVFLTPVIMYGLSKLGIISKESWKGYFRWVFLGSIIVGAIITPDGSGITQLLFAGTFMGLYLLGILIIKLKV